MNTALLLKEFQYKMSRSSGPGGQHANKVSSRVSLFFKTPTSKALSEVEKMRITEKLGTKLTQEGVLILHCDETRSQLKNKLIVTKRGLELLETTLKRRPIRKATKPKRSAIEKRLKHKKINSQRKQSRGKPANKEH